MILRLQLAYKAISKRMDIHHVSPSSAWPKAGQASSFGLNLVIPLIVSGPASRQKCVHY
jgi:hypothetical protein